MNKVKSAFLGLGEVTPRSFHQTFNTWHSGDHIPENLAAPGTVWGQRFVAPPRYADERSPGSEKVAGAQYLFVYFMKEPVWKSIRDFSTIGLQTRTLGRMEPAKILQAGHFNIVGSWADERIVISPEALPYRPSKGVLLTMGDLEDSDRRDELLQWNEEVHIPDMLKVPGVMGAYTFWSRGGAITAAGLDNPSGRYATIYYLDKDPLHVSKVVKEMRRDWEANGRLLDSSGWTAPVIDGAFQTIQPSQHDWFGA